MRESLHFKTRCLQRRISNNDVDMALQFGIQNGGKIVLSEKSCLALIKSIDHWISEIEMAKKGGEFKVRRMDA